MDIGKKEKFSSMISSYFQSASDIYCCDENARYSLCIG
jgi:hypothetical protein